MIEDSLTHVEEF